MVKLSCSYKQMYSAYGHGIGLKYAFFTHWLGAGDVKI